MLSKAKQSKAKRLLYILIFALFIFNSCSDELITIVDEYNPPYEIKAIPGSNSISINFWSGVLANDFLGFNLYSSASPSFTNAILNSDGSYPTVRVDTHTRSNFTLEFPRTNSNVDNYYTNQNLYYVGVTAYGTNDLAEGGKIETKVNAIPVVPRAETTGTINNNIIAGSLTATTNNNTITATGWKVKSYGYQTNFNAVTIFTNSNNLTNSAPYLVGGLYIFSNDSNTDLVKVWITNNGYIYATNSKANVCNTI